MNENPSRGLSGLLARCSRWQVALLVAVVGAMLILGPGQDASSVEAHHDKPGPPPILVAATLDKLKSNHGGEIGDEEVLVEWIASQLPGHLLSQIADFKLIEDIDFENGDVLVLNEPIYIHKECDPMHPLSLNFRVTEIDTDVRTTIIGGLLVASAFRASFAVPAVGLALAAAGAVVFLISLNGDDNLGSVSTAAPPLGTFTVTTLGGGAEGSADVTYTADIGDQVGPECDPPPPTPSPSPPPTTPTPTSTPIDECPPPNAEKPSYTVSVDRDAITDAYGEWQTALTDAAQAQVEAGNPGGVTVSELAQDRQTARDTIVNTIVDSMTEAAIESIAGTPEFGAASDALATARSVAQSDLDGSVAIYETAALIAMDKLIECYPPSSGGIAEPLGDDAAASAESAGSFSGSTLPLAAAAGGALVALAIAGLYVRRRLVR